MIHRSPLPDVAVPEQVDDLFARIAEAAGMASHVGYVYVSGAAGGEERERAGYRPAREVAATGRSPRLCGARLPSQPPRPRPRIPAAAGGTTAE